LGNFGGILCFIFLGHVFFTFVGVSLSIGLIFEIL
jgi:hypothetical protein